LHGDTACDRRFGAIARQMILERAENTQREAGPDRRTEIKRHPGNLVLPLGKIVGHDPTRAHVTETLERPQKLAAIGDFGPPSAQIHRDVDDHEKHQIAYNPDDRDGEDRANRTIEFRHQSAKANPNDEEGSGPYRIFDGVAQIVGCQYRMPGETFRDEDQRHDRPGDVQVGVRSRYRAQLVQGNRPLRRAADTGARPRSARRAQMRRTD